MLRFFTNQIHQSLANSSPSLSLSSSVFPPSYFTIHIFHDLHSHPVSNSSNFESRSSTLSQTPSDCSHLVSCPTLCFFSPPHLPLLSSYPHHLYNLCFVIVLILLFHGLLSVYMSLLYSPFLLRYHFLLLRLSVALNILICTKIQSS